MTPGRLTRWDALALLAALALVLTMAMDWYSTKQGEEFRRDEKLVDPGPLGDTQPSARERLAEAAEKEEENAWQADGALDRVILVVLLAAAAMAVLAALRRGIGRPPSAGLTPSALAGWLGLAGALLVTYRIIDAPGDDDISVIKLGAPLALLMVGLLALGSRFAALAEREAALEGPAADRETGAEGVFDHEADERTAST
jgi:hypothetical protein